MPIFTTREISVTLHCANLIFGCSGPIKANFDIFEKVSSLLIIHSQMNIVYVYSVSLGTPWYLILLRTGDTFCNHHLYIRSYNI